MGDIQPAPGFGIHGSGVIAGIPDELVEFDVLPRAPLPAE
jgi:hypothetical protein